MGSASQYLPLIEARLRRASSFQCTKRVPAEHGAQIAPIFAITNYIEHQYQDVEVRLKALHRNSQHPRQTMETEASLPVSRLNEFKRVSIGFVFNNPS
jgi:hypothetical protein